MNDCLEQNLYNAKLKCDCMYSSDLSKCGLFDRIYPFTTENIAGYINLFDLNDKSLLTIGSSGDQVINASLFNCKDQTVVDINPFTRYYFYLKKAAILSITYQEFLNFFLYYDYPKLFAENKQAFDKDTFNKIKLALKSEDYDSFYFWNELLSLYDSKKIRTEMFMADEDRSTVLKETNIYMKNPTNFEKAKSCIRDVNPKFICSDIMKIKLERNYDNIFLSNLGLYLGIDNLKTLIEKLYPYVNEQILICYLYQTDEHTKYMSHWSEIYNIDKLKSVLEDYIISFNSFCGVKGILFGDENYAKDSIIMCKKNKVIKKMR